MSYTRRPFSPSGEFVARREFRFAGRDFRPGESFPWRRLACSPRKLRALYEGGQLTFKDEDLVTEPVTDEAQIESSTEGEPDETVEAEETGDEDDASEEDASEVVEKPKKKKKKKVKSND